VKIALVSSYMPPHPGGIEHVAGNLFKGYQGAGHEVRWITSRIPRTLARREGPFVRIPTFNLAEDLLGVPIPVWGPGALRELREAAEWADVLHVVEALYLPCAMAVWAGRRARKPVLVCQNVGFIPYRSRVLEWIERGAYATLGRWVLLAASHVVLTTPTADQFVRALLGDRLRRVSTFPVGIDTGAFRPAGPEERAAARAALQLAPAARVALFAGRLVEKKGVPLVLACAARLPDVTFLLAGDGPLRSLLERAPPNVRRLGQVEAAAMRRLYWASDAVLLPSRGEGLPLFVQEAMACGLPAVVSDDEIYAAALVADRVCQGAPRTPEGLAAGLSAALDAPGMGLAARAHAERHWGLDAMVRGYEAILQPLAAPRGA
jgi:glycosyltransferase involved in cell wall biosynthesis